MKSLSGLGHSHFGAPGAESGVGRVRWPTPSDDGAIRDARDVRLAIVLAGQEAVKIGWGWTGARWSGGRVGGWINLRRAGCGGWRERS